MSNYNPNDFVNPQQIRSPYTGETAFPTYQNYEQGGKTYEQAVFTDPVTGHIIKKGIVSIKDKEGKVIADFNSVHANYTSVTSRSLDNI